MKVREVIEHPSIQEQAQQLDDFYQGALALADSEDVSVEGFSMDNNSFRFIRDLAEIDADVFDVFSQLLKKYVERCIRKYEVLRSLKLQSHTADALIFKFSPPVARNTWHIFYFNIGTKRELESLGDLKEEQGEDYGIVTYKLLNALLKQGKRVELDVRTSLSGRSVQVKGIIHAINHKPPHVITYDHKLDRKPEERVQSSSFFIPNGPLDDTYELEELPNGTWHLIDAT